MACGLDPNFLDEEQIAVHLYHIERRRMQEAEHTAFYLAKTLTALLRVG